MAALSRFNGAHRRSTAEAYPLFLAEASKPDRYHHEPNRLSHFGNWPPMSPNPTEIPSPTRKPAKANGHRTGPSCDPMPIRSASLSYPVPGMVRA
jgi:hypothetical protein